MRKGILVEWEDIIVLWHFYLRKMKCYRAENKNIIFLDETWMNVGHSVMQAWRDVKNNLLKDALQLGWPSVLSIQLQGGLILSFAPYHSRRFEKLPTTECTVGNIKEWLSSKNIEFTKDSLKRELLTLVNAMREQYSFSETDRRERFYHMWATTVSLWTLSLIHI